MNNIILSCNKVSKNYLDNNQSINILSNIDLQIFQGQKVAIMGRSGSGKTTLLQLLSGLDLPDAGDIVLCGKHLSRINQEEKTFLLNNNIGFIYQLHHLLPEFTALENVCMPLLIQQKPFKLAKSTALNLLKELGLQHRSNSMPNKLSGGERQRVAIARALINNPACIFADEPTGNLDLESANETIELIHSINKKYNATIIMVTHDISLTNNFDSIYQLANGCLNLRCG